MAKEPLPRPEVNVTSNPVSGNVDLVISRDGKTKNYSVPSGSFETVAKDLIRKVIDDHHTAEWLP